MPQHQRRIESAINALGKCRDKFAEYFQHHAAKAAEAKRVQAPLAATVEALELKAHRNNEMILVAQRGMMDLQELLREDSTAWIFDLIREERHYQDWKYGASHNMGQSLAGYLLILRRELQEAEEGWFEKNGGQGRDNVFNELVQIAAVCVAALQARGAPGFFAPGGVAHAEPPEPTGYGSEPGDPNGDDPDGEPPAPSFLCINYGDMECFNCEHIHTVDVHAIVPKECAACEGRGFWMHGEKLDQRKDCVVCKGTGEEPDTGISVETLLKEIAVDKQVPVHMLKGEPSPAIVCAGCGKPATIFKPICDECNKVMT